MHDAISWIFFFVAMVGAWSLVEDIHKASTGTERTWAHYAGDALLLIGGALGFGL